MKLKFSPDLNLSQFQDYFSIEALKDIYFKKVKGKIGKGIDGISCDLFERYLLNNLEQIHSKINSNQYKFVPYKEKLISKGRFKKPRVISIPSIRDIIVLRALNNYLQARLPSSIPHSIPNSIISEIKKVYLQQSHNANSLVFRYDIKNFFPTIKIPTLYNILYQKSREGFLDLEAISLIMLAIQTPTVPLGSTRQEYTQYWLKEGIPQGLPISNILAEIYLESLDHHLKKITHNYWRYVDDILIFDDSFNKVKIETTLQKELKKLGITKNTEKSDSYPINHKFSYLGYLFIDSKISVSQKSKTNHLKGISDIFNWYKSKKSDKTIDQDILYNALIDKLNEKITGAINEGKRYGWIFYYSEITDITVLHSIDAIISAKFKRVLQTDSIDQKLKKSVKSYYEIQHTPFGGYIFNYNRYRTDIEKKNFLISRGIIHEEAADLLPTKEIRRRFNSYKKHRLSRLLRDVGVFS